MIGAPAKKDRRDGRVADASGVLEQWAGNPKLPAAPHAPRKAIHLDWQLGQPRELALAAGDRDFCRGRRFGNRAAGRSRSPDGNTV